MASEEVRLLHRVLPGVMKHAYKMDLISRNPMSQVSSRSVVKAEPAPPAIPAVRQALALTLGEGSPYYACIHLIAYTCMRRREAMSLMRDNVELAQGHIWIEGSLKPHPGDGCAVGAAQESCRPSYCGAGHLDVVVPAQHREQQQEMEELYVERGVVFASPYRDWMNPDNLSEAAKRLREKVGYPPTTLRSLRHFHDRYE